MSLSDALLLHRPRETSGGPASNRFDYQRTWSLCHLLELHSTHDSYVLVLEYHDDVLVLDDDVRPQEVQFFQVKTRKNGQWSKRDLLARPKPKRTRKKAGARRGTAQAAQGTTAKGPNPQSIIGKLLSPCLHFLPHLGRLTVVSNAPFNIKLSQAPTSENREQFCLSELDASVLSEVESSVRPELGLVGPIPWSKTFLRTCGISITDHEKYGVGELAEFLQRRRPGGRFAVQPLFRALCGELGRRRGTEWQPTSFAELCAKQGIRRSDFESFLKTAEAHVDFSEEALRGVKDQLLREAVDYRSVVALEAAWRRYDVEKIDRTNALVHAIEIDCASVVARVAAAPQWRKVREFLELAYSEYLLAVGSPTPPLNENYIKGALLYEYKLHETRVIQAASSQSSTGAT